MFQDIHIMVELALDSKRVPMILAFSIQQQQAMILTHQLVKLEI